MLFAPPERFDAETARSFRHDDPCIGHPARPCRRVPGAAMLRAMDLRLVEYFVAVIDHGSVTRAARALYIAQPSLSQAIRTLERQLGVHLFHRTGRKLVLTKDGAAFVEPARRLLRDMDRARAVTREVRTMRSGQLDLSALATLAVDPLTKLVGRFRQDHPGVLVNIMDAEGSSQVITDVRHGRAELGLTDLPVRGESLRSHELDQQEIALVLPPSLAMDLPDPVPLSAIADIPLVMEFGDIATRALVNDALRPTGHTIAVECAHRQAIWHLVKHGAGATFLPRDLANREPDGVGVRATIPRIQRRIGFVFRSGQLSPAAERFIELAGTSAAPADDHSAPAPGTPGPREKAAPGRTALHVEG